MPGSSSRRRVLWRREIPAETTRQALGTLLGLGINDVTPTTTTLDAQAIAASLGWAWTYDAEYMALARTLGVPLVTATRASHEVP